MAKSKFKYWKIILVAIIVTLLGFTLYNWLIYLIDNFLISFGITDLNYRYGIIIVAGVLLLLAIGMPFKKVVKKMAES
jgi:hypothetical protein